LILCLTLLAPPALADEPKVSSHEIRLAPGFMDGGSYRIDEPSQLVVRLHGPDAARVRLLVKLGRAPNTDSYDFDMDGSQASELRIPDAKPGTWQIFVLHGNQTEAAHAWARSLPQDLRGPAPKHRPFSDNADQKVTLEVSTRPRRAFAKGQGLRVIQGGSRLPLSLRSKAQLRVIPGGK
jgi:hypothetical protein